MLIKSKKQYVFGKTKVLGAKHNKQQGFFHYIDNRFMVGTHIKNKIPKVSFIKNVSFYITDQGFPDTKFRVRIYEADTFGIPQRELLDSNYFGQGTSAGNEWVTVSLKQANVKFPPYGVIVVMEWLPLAKEKLTIVKYGNNKWVYKGQCLGGTHEFDYINTYHNHENELVKEMPITPVNGIIKTIEGTILHPNTKIYYLNPMIRLELDIVK